MSAKDPEPKKSRAATVREHWSDKQDLSGSASPWLTCNLANQVLRLPWRGSREDSDTKLLHDQAMLAAMAGLAPRDPVEGLLAAQMVAVHEASMECFRRAALPEQIFAGRELGLKYGDKLARTYAALVETLDRHRGKGQQVVRVERVTVEAGGQAIVGAVSQGGTKKVRINPMHRDPSPMNRSPRCGARTRSGSPCRSPAVRGGKRCRMHGGAAGSGAPTGNRNAFRHGRYTRELIEFRRTVRDLLRESAEKLQLV